MHVQRYGRGFARRVFLEKLAAGAAAAGVLAPLWEVLAADGTAARAYPEELRSIEAYTRGRLTAGQSVTADTVHLVKDLLDPVRYHQVAHLGRRLDLVAGTGELMRLSPWEYVEATLRHAGRARVAADGNVVADDGRPWIGGHPFPGARTGGEIMAGQTLGWGRHDVSVYMGEEFDVEADGSVTYQYQTLWAEAAAVGRVAVDPKPYWPGREDVLRWQAVYFLAPRDTRSGYLSTWPYDQNRLPTLLGYLPQFKRVRSLPTNQRFEPLVPGSALYLSDAWAAGDPFLMWSNYRIVHRGPALAALSGNWMASDPGWRRGTHGGGQGRTFWDTRVELIPEAIVVEAEPTGFPRAPVSRKRVWFDARTLLPFVMVSYDRRGEVFRSFDGAYSLYESGGRRVMDGAHPYWSWTHIHAHEVQTGRVTRIQQIESLAGHRMQVNTPDAYDAFLTETALRRFGG